MNKYIVTLTKEERELLSDLASKGEHKSQKILNALILLGCDAGDFQINRSKNEEIAKVLNISMKKIDRVKKRFVEEGIDVALDKRKADRIYKKKAGRRLRSSYNCIELWRSTRGIFAMVSKITGR